MTLHVPYAEGPDDEFKHPDLGWVLIDRALVFDGWLTWRHALPEDPGERLRLTSAVSDAITSLAQALHDVHVTLPDYGALGESPFHVPRWWDPDSEDGWDSGRCCLLRVEGYSSEVFQAAGLAQSERLGLALVSERYLEARLLTIPARSPAAARQRATLRSSVGARRKRPSPPVGIPDLDRSAPASALC